MKPAFTGALWLSSAGMELAVLGTWASWMLAAIGVSVTAVLFVTAFAGAAIATRAIRGRGLRWIHVLVLHAGVMLALAVGAARALGLDSGLLDGDRVPVDWLKLTIVFAWAVAFWRSGVRHADRQPSYAEVVRRFDASLGWLLGWLFLELLVQDWRFESGASEKADLFVVPAFVLGVVAVAIARNRGDARKRFIEGHPGVGELFLFGTAIFACVVTVALALLPLLRVASRAGSGGFISVAEPGAAQLVDWIFSLFDWERSPLSDNLRESLAGGARGSASVDSLPSKRPSTGSFSLIGWVALGLFAIVAAWLARHRLFRRVGDPSSETSWYSALRDWLGRVLASLRAAFSRWRRLQREPEPVRLYRGLVGWGRRSGIPIRPNETAAEYGRRLTRDFDPIALDVEPIIAVFNGYLYGNCDDDVASVDRARRALRCLRSPLLWAKRLESRMLGDGR